MKLAASLKTLNQKPDEQDMMSPEQPKKKAENSEPMTATKRLLAGLRDGKLADLELVGDDGVRVPALRCVLACASPVMHKLLYGDTSRATQSVVKISGCSNKTLRALVEYCCSDELNASIWDGSCPPSEIVKDIVALARVSHAYGIPNMEERVLEGINPLMNAIPPLACVVFNYSDATSTKAIYMSSLTLIRKKPYTCLQQEGQNVGGLVCLTPERLKEIFQDTQLEVDELFLFKQLVRWRSYNMNRYSNATEVCKQLVRLIDLTYIDPQDIKAIVLDSGLVEDRTIIEALLEQSTSATREGLAFAAMRGPKAQDQVYAMVQNTGSHEIDGLYRQIQKDGTLLCYAKAIGERRMIFLLKDSPTSWKICDSDNLFYEWRSANESHHDQFPVTGWFHATRNRGSNKPLPTVKWFRPRGSTPRLPTSSRMSSSMQQQSHRIPVVPYTPRISPGDDGLQPGDRTSQLSARPNQAMEDQVMQERRQSPSPTAFSPRSQRSPHSTLSHSTHSHHSPQSHHSYPKDKSPHLHTSPHMLYSPHPHPHQPLRSSQSMKEEYYHSPNNMPGISSIESSPHTAMAVRHNSISPRTPSPRLQQFTSMAPVKESSSWAV